MRTFSLSKIFPCTSFFSEGRFIMGGVVLLLQLSVVFWPVATQLGRRKQEQTGVERLLAELSETHYVPADPYARATKKFRTTPELQRAV